MKGLLLLHSFEYDDAREAFLEAQEIDPNLAMAYWGEAMTHNHPIWQEVDRDAAIAVLYLMPDEALSNISAREQGYFSALDVLLGDSDDDSVTKEDRDDAYAVAMGELAATYHDDENAALFHALAILGTAHEGRDFDIYDRAGQIALEVFERNPLNPGAAHYVIHAYDDPLNAEKALEAAQAYSQIAPDAPHALHMPTHIYFALGMWDEGAELNRRSFEAARRRDEAADQPLGGHGWHPLYWLHYAELQRGRFEEARRLFDEAMELVDLGPSSRGRSSIVAMRANHLIETMDWTGDVAQMELPIDDAGISAKVRDAFVRAIVALNRHDLQTAQRIKFDVQELLLDREAGQEELITACMLDGLIELEKGDVDHGLELLREATELEDQMPIDFGPPVPPKPSHEVLGEVLYSLERYAEAQIEFRKALERAPRRLHSLAGLAHAALAAGDEDTANATQAIIHEIMLGGE